MPENTYQAGTTVRLECEFFGFDKEPKDPDLTKLVVYDQKYQIIHEEQINENNRTAAGKYFYDYVTPFETRPQRYYYEWYGEILGSPSLKRDTFKTVFA